MVGLYHVGGSKPPCVRSGLVNAEPGVLIYRVSYIQEEKAYTITDFVGSPLYESLELIPFSLHHTSSCPSSELSNPIEHVKNYAE